jgi:hypothetical protein
MKRVIWDWHNRATGATAVALALLSLVGVSAVSHPAATDP